MDLQKMVDLIGISARNARSDYHLTLGLMIEELIKLPGDMVIKFDFNNKYPESAKSYRGYYSDLALDWSDEKKTVGDVLEILQNALGSTFQGYKGGDFLMDKKTPLWASEYGNSSGIAIIGLQEGWDGILINTKQVDD